MAETETIEAPGSRKTFKVNKDTDLKVFMSFQRLNSLLRILGTGDNLPLLTIDPDLSEGCMRVLLAPKAVDQFAVDLEDYEIEPDVYEEMILWCRDHLTYFFTKQLRLLGEQNQKLAPEVSSLALSLAGSAPSTSAPAPAGLSE